MGLKNIFEIDYTGTGEGELPVDWRNTGGVEKLPIEDYMDPMSNLVEQSFENDPYGLWKTARSYQLGERAGLPQFADVPGMGFSPQWGGYLLQGGLGTGIDPLTGGRETATFADYLRQKKAGAYAQTPAMGWEDLLAAANYNIFNPTGPGLGQSRLALKGFIDPVMAGAETSKTNTLSILNQLMGGGRGYAATLRRKSLENLYNLYSTRALAEGTSPMGIIGQVARMMGLSPGDQAIGLGAGATNPQEAMRAAIDSGVYVPEKPAIVDPGFPHPVPDNTQFNPLTAIERFVDPTMASQNEAALNAAIASGVYVPEVPTYGTNIGTSTGDLGDTTRYVPSTVTGQNNYDNQIVQSMSDLEFATKNNNFPWMNPPHAVPVNKFWGF